MNFVLVLLTRGVLFMHGIFTCPSYETDCESLLLFLGNLRISMFSSTFGTSFYANISDQAAC